MNTVNSFRPALYLAVALISSCASSSQKAAPAGLCMRMLSAAPSSDQEAPATSGLDVLTITPPQGSKVRRSTVLMADLAYTVKDFEPGKYIVLAQFDTNSKSKTTDGHFDGYPILKYANGIFRMCFPLSNVWDLPDLQRPLSVRFLLNKTDDARRSHSVAHTDPISFPAGQL
jgi:hypothetical protein